MIVVTLLWLLVEKSTLGGCIVFALYLTASVFNSGNGIAQTRYILHMVPLDKQNHINIINIISNLTVACGPLLAGLMLHATKGAEFHSGAVSLNNYHMLFLLVAVAFVPAHLLRKRLGMTKETPTAHVITFVSQSIRSTFSPFLRFNIRNNKSDEAES